MTLAPAMPDALTADGVVERLRCERAMTAPDAHAQDVVRVVAESVGELAYDAALVERLGRADCTVCIELLDAPEPGAELTLTLRPDGLDARDDTGADADVRLLMRTRDLARMWAGEVQLTILIAEGEVGYEGPVREVLRVMPILTWALRRQRAAPQQALTRILATYGPDPALSADPPHLEASAGTSDLLDRAAGYSEAAGVHERTTEFGERQPGEFWSVRCHNVSKTFGSNHVLRNLNFSIPEGLITVVLGPSGTGKSVLINHLIGLSFPQEGEIVVHGESLSDMRRSRLAEVRKKFGILFQDGALFGSMSMFDNVAFPLRQHTDRDESDIRDRVVSRLGEVGLADHMTKMPNELSGGMKKRAGFARALMLDPSVVLFDEPDSGLDPVRTGLLCELIRETHAHHGGTYVVITHDIASARQVGQYIAVLWKGRIVQAGSAERMFDSENPFVRQFLNRDLDGPLGME